MLKKAQLDGKHSKAYLNHASHSILSELFSSWVSLVILFFLVIWSLQVKVFCLRYLDCNSPLWRSYFNVFQRSKCCDGFQIGSSTMRRCQLLLFGSLSLNFLLVQNQSFPCILLKPDKLLSEVDCQLKAMLSIFKKCFVGFFFFFLPEKQF